jgi:hypothetical protein
VPGRGLRRIFAKIRTFAISASVRTRTETNAHVFDAFWRARARPGAQPRAHRAASSQTRATARASTCKASQGFNRTPPLALDLAGAQDHRRLPCTRVPVVARAPTTVDRPTEPYPAPSYPRERLYVPR